MTKQEPKQEQIGRVLTPEELRAAITGEINLAYRRGTRNEPLPPDFLTNQILSFIKKAGHVKLAAGDKVICKTAWDLLSPAIKAGIESEEKKSGWKVKDEKV